MERLITFGCSNTYGYGLDDCWEDDSNPSNIGWAAIMARELGKVYINKGITGASNKLIWHQILRTKFKPGDTVFILWSYIDRHTVLTSKNKFIHLHANKLEQPESESYYKLLYASYDSKLMSTLYVDHATRLLTDLGVTFYQSIIFKEYNFVFGQHPHVPIYFNDYERYYERALDGLHMGAQGNVAFAKDLLEAIGVSTNIIKPPKTISEADKILKWIKQLCK